MKKLMLVEQPFGAGDIIYTQSLIHDFINEGYEIIWPVSDHTVPWMIEAYPAIKFIPESLVRPEMLQIKKDEVINDMRVIPIRFAEFIMGRPYKLHMISKYDLYGKDWRMWKQHAMPMRNAKREKELRESLGITNGMKYNFIQTRFGNNGQRQLSITENNGLPNIEMRINDGFTLFDYIGIIEHAETIHAVSSGTLYLFEILDLQAKSIHIYNRTPIEPNLDYVRFIFTKNYILHE